MDAGSRGRASVVIHIHVVTEIVEVGRCREMPRMHCLCTRILSKFQLVKRWNECQRCLIVRQNAKRWVRKEERKLSLAGWKRRSLSVTN